MRVVRNESATSQICSGGCYGDGDHVVAMVIGLGLKLNKIKLIKYIKYLLMLPILLALVADDRTLVRS